MIKIMSIQISNYHIFWKEQYVYADLRAYCMSMIIINVTTQQIGGWLKVITYIFVIA